MDIAKIPQKPQASREYNLLVAGAGGVGRRCFIERMFSGLFLEGYDPTGEDRTRKLCTIDDESVILQLDRVYDIDTFGQHVRTGSSVLILYDITSRYSFDEIENIYSCCCQKWSWSVIMLVGTKSDLEHMRQVPKEEGEAVARAWKCGFKEVSSKDGTNIEKTVYDAVRIIRKRQVEEVDSSVEVIEGTKSEMEKSSKKSKKVSKRKCIVM